ncbi:hypothetical protein Tco_1104833 [Tanacetum coccineum]
MIHSCLKNIGRSHILIPQPVPFEQLLDDFMNPPDELVMDDSELDTMSYETPIVSPFLDSDNESDDGEVINELNEYGNVGDFYCNRIISSFNGNDLAFPCIIEGLESMRRNLVAIVWDVYVFVGSFTYITDFVVLEDIGEFIVSDMTDVVMGRPFRAVTQLEYDCVKGFNLIQLPCLLGLWYLSKVYLWVASLCFGLPNRAWFLELKREWGGKRVKEKNKDVAAKDGVSPSMTVGTVVMENKISLVDTNVPTTENMELCSYPPLPTQGSTPAGNTPGMSSYANVTEESIKVISKRLANTAYGFFLGKRVAYLVVANYVRNTWGKYGLVKSMLNSSTRLFTFQFSSMYGLNAFSDDGLSAIATKIGTTLILDSYTSDMCLQSWGRITGEGYYTCNVRVEYEWKPLGVGVAKNLKKPSQTSRGVPVGPKVGFKPHKEYRLVPKKATANSSGNKKKGVEPTNEVDPRSGMSKIVVLILLLLLIKTGKYESLIIDGQAILMDEDSNPLKKDRVDFGTQSLLEQWRDSYGNGDYDDDPYDDDMYEGQDLLEELQTICDNLDI